MFVDNINPVIFSFHGLTIRYYGVVWALSFLFAWWYLNKNRKLLKIDSDEVIDILLIDVLFILFFSKIFSVYIYRPENLIETLRGHFRFFFRSEFSALGGFFGLVLGNAIISKHYHIDFWKLNDLTLLPIILGIAFGRIANFTNHEFYGIPSNLPWCVVFFPGGVCRHPTQLYESLAYFIAFFIGLWIKIRTYGSSKRKLAYGSTFVFLSFYYFVARFLAEFVKAKVFTQPILFSLDTTQVILIIYLIFYVPLFWRRIVLVSKKCFAHFHSH